MNIVCERTGKPVRARGLWQWTECYHPEISDECAYDVYCSTVSFFEYVKGKPKRLKEWTVYRNLTDS